MSKLLLFPNVLSAILLEFWLEIIFSIESGPRSSKRESFDVVNLWQTMGRSARRIPVPLSLIWISFRPPSPRTTGDVI